MPHGHNTNNQFNQEPGFLNIQNLEQQQGGGINASQIGGLVGLLGGPAGGIVGGAAGAGFDALASLFSGDGGFKKRRREAQNAFRGLQGSTIDENFLTRSAGQFQRANLPGLQKLFQRSASRVGLGSGIGQSAALEQFSELLARFNSQNLLQERQRVSRDRRVGAQGLASLVG